MKILKIESNSINKEKKIVITLEGYPHAKPVFPADISEEELKTKLAEWKINQDEVDAINANAVAEKVVEKDISELRDLEGKEI